MSLLDKLRSYMGEVKYFIAIEYDKTETIRCLSLVTNSRIANLIYKYTEYIPIDIKIEEENFELKEITTNGLDIITSTNEFKDIYAYEGKWHNEKFIHNSALIGKMSNGSYGLYFKSPKSLHLFPTMYDLLYFAKKERPSVYTHFEIAQYKVDIYLPRLICLEKRI